MGGNMTATELRSLSQSRAANPMQFSHFSAVDQPTRERLYPLFAGHPQS
jgi:translation elongation factor EF-G